jgi:hypothetical protein
MTYQTVQGGAGDLIWIPSGVSATTSGMTPRRFGILQDVSIDFAGSMKELYGKNRVAINIMDTELKISGKAKTAQLKADLFNFFFGATAPVAGATRRVVIDEAATPSSGTGTYQVTNHATFVEDLGVYDTVTGTWLTEVASTATPIAGQYKAASGVYTFVAGFADPCLISYSYTVAAGALVTAVNMVIPNIAMGTGPRFGLVMTNAQIDGLQCTIKLYKCLSSKLTLGWKNNDWSIPEFDFAAMDNGSGSIGDINLDQAQ